MVDQERQELETGFDRQEKKLPWVSCFGATAGLVAGVILTMLTSAYLDHWMPKERMAEVVWEIGAPLLGLMGVVAGFWVFQRFLSGHAWLAGVFCLALLVLGFYMAFFWVGFPWRE